MLVLAALVASLAQAGTPSSFILEGAVIAGGGSNQVKNSCFTLSSTIAESVVGVASSVPGPPQSTFILSGFWGAQPLKPTDSLLSDSFEDCGT
ncbi:MAG: hypothetical protein ABI411_21125 [Tahibacter sp.]